MQTVTCSCTALLRVPDAGGRHYCPKCRAVLDVAAAAVNRDVPGKSGQTPEPRVQAPAPWRSRAWPRAAVVLLVVTAAVLVALWWRL